MTVSSSATSETPSTTERVLARIRDDIVSGRRPPGTPLRLAALAHELGASMAVVREALFRLTEQRLATSAPNQGFRVIEVSRKDLVDLTEVRVDVESSALRRSIRAGDVAWQGRVVAAHHVLESSEVGADGWALLHQDFHDALCSGCDNDRLVSLARTLRDNAEVYRQLYGAGGDTDGRDVPGEHRKLMELALARDEEGAANALRTHLELTRDGLLSTGLLK